MATVWERVLPLELIWTNAHIEARYPDFPEIAAMDLDSCCMLDEVAERYGWGDATDAWDGYDGARFLLGLR